MSYLEKIEKPSDIKKLSEIELDFLAEEIRHLLINVASKNGGHLAPNLGVVELTIALHKCFDSPKDKIIWDVGHQIYTHKLLTGRKDLFDTIRKENGLSGFSSPKESEHDIFYSGHASVSISEALGVATANFINGNKDYTVAVIGDGALTGGLSYEALNNAGRSDKRLIVILNDNEMSISKNVGSISKHLTAIRSKPGYFHFKAHTESFLNKLPFGKKLVKRLYLSKTRLKNIIYQSTFFEDMGFQYMGPVDGHNIKKLENVFEEAKLYNRPVLIHINTIKGKGYDPAENNPGKFHGISKFDINTGELLSGGTNFSKELGNFLCDVAKKDKRICAVTAAMGIGTGLERFSREFPKRYFDVGIAEEHAVTFSSGLAKGGYIPIFCVYSTFLQRTYDQLVHDFAMQNIHAVVAIDRAGFVGDDGISHQGLLDTTFLNGIPNITVYSPSTYSELKENMINAIYHNEGIVFVRYPRGAEDEILKDFNIFNETFEFLGEADSKICLVTYGKIFSNVYKAYKDLLSKDISVSILKLNRIIPIDNKSIINILNCKKILFFEEGMKFGGIGETFALKLLESGFKGKFCLTAVENSFVPHSSIESLIKKYKLDSKNIVNKVLMEINE